MSEAENNEQKKSSTSRAIGIDLGTTYSCVASYINGKVEVITNPDGERTTPSVVAFDDCGSVIVGTPAKGVLSSDPASVVFDAKRMIGRSFDEDNISKCKDKWPFEIVRYNFQTKSEENVKGSTDTIDNIAIKINKSGKVSYYSPIEISAQVLTYLKKAAEAKLGHAVKEAVITVPAYFKERQKERTREAAEIAGFAKENIRLLAEPTAAAMAYGYIQTSADDARDKVEDILVFDLGGGTFDTSVVHIEISKATGSIGIVKATDGDTFLGGVDFDNLLIQYAVNEFIKKNPSLNKSEIKENAMLRLRSEVVRTKAFLSSTTSSQIFVPCFHGTVDLNVPITRSKFEFLCEPLFKRCLERVKGCILLAASVPNVEYSKDGDTLLMNAELSRELDTAKSNINKVILAGGSSRIPKVKAMLADFFGKDKICEPVNPDEAIAYGAAYQAASIFSDVISADSGLLLIDCCPLNLSIETAGGISTVLIPANSNIPVKKTETFTTYADNQTAVTINVYEGNRSLAADNCKIGSFNLDGIEPAPRGVPQIEVTFEMDENGVLSVTSVDKKSSKKAGMTVTNTQSRMSKEQIEEMKNAAKKFEEADKKAAEKIKKKTDFESMIHTIKGYVNQATIPEDKKNEILEKLKQHDEWVSSINASNYDENELEARNKDLMEISASLNASAGPNQHPNAGGNFTAPAA